MIAHHDSLSLASELVLFALEQNQKKLKLSSHQVSVFKHKLYAAQRELQAERYMSEFLAGQSEMLNDLMDSVLLQGASSKTDKIDQQNQKLILWTYEYEGIRHAKKFCR